jgi:tetratricopeptide (TPR) repeat protein
MIIALALAALLIQDAPDIVLPGAAVSEPESRVHLSLEERLDERLAALLVAETEADSDLIADEIRSLWRQAAGPTADLLLQRAATALTAGDRATADRAYTHLRLLEPDYAEGWVASAELAARQGDWSFALEALDTAVTLEPRRFDAWALLGQALERAGANEAALEAYDEALALHPLHPAAGRGQARLRRELAGRAL